MAIQEDPNFGLAYAGLADTYQLMVLQGWIDKDSGLRKTFYYANRAIRSNSGHAEARAAMGSLYIFYLSDWEEAEKELLEAIRINPNYSTAYQYYAELLSITRRKQEARKYINRAIELDPYSFIIRHISMELYCREGKFEQALAENHLCRDLCENHKWALEASFEIYYQLEMEDETLDAFKKCGMLFKSYDPKIADSVYSTEGIEGLLRVKINSGADTWQKMCWHAMLGEYDKSMDLMEEYYLNQKSKYFAPLYRVEFRALYSNPRFQNILELMGKKEYVIGKLPAS